MSFSTVATLVLLATSAQALDVIAPSEGMTTVAGRSYQVEWNGVAADARFDIDLTYCGSYSFCFDDNCGFLLDPLCPEAEGCAQDTHGGYEVVMPEPLVGVSSNGYRVRIAEVGGQARVRCSDDFYLMASADVAELGEAGIPSIDILSPAADDVGVSGEEYTVQFDYSNGLGGETGRFKIDLYFQASVESPLQGDCGQWVGSICDRPDIGCRDTQGDYDVVIPSVTESGMYKIRVGVFGDDSVYACSEAFEIMPPFL